MTWDQNLAFGGMWWGGWMWWEPWGMWGFPWMWSWMNAVPLWERGDGEAEGIFSGDDEKILSPSDSSFQKGAQEDFPDFEWFNFGSGDVPTPPDFNWWGGRFPWWDFPWWWEDWERKWPGMNGDNLLKTRLLANEKFKAMYDEIYAKIEEIALNSDFSENFFNEWTNAFYKYNSSKELVTESAYSQWVEKLKSYLENKKSS